VVDTDGIGVIHSAERCSLPGCSSRCGRLEIGAKLALTAAENGSWRWKPTWLTKWRI